MAYGGRSPWQYVGLALIAVVTVALVAMALTSDPDPGGSTASPDPAPAEPSASAPACTPPARVAVLGDTTRTDKPPGKAYVDELAALLPDSEVRSFAKDTKTLDIYVTHPVQQQVDAWEPDAVEVSLGVSDLRLDQSARRADQFTAELGSFVDGLQVRFPDSRIVLTVPAALSTTPAGGVAYVRPPAAAAKVTRELRASYLDVAGARPWVTLVDAQQEVTGTEADPSDPPLYLVDQIHPTPETAARIAALVADRLGCPA